MRMLMHVLLPNEPFNTYVKDGSAGKKIQRIVAHQKPEAVYFTEYEGQRSGILIVNIDNPSQVPALAEPWFLGFNADVKLRIVMSPEDLSKAGLEKIGKKWG